MSAEALKVDLPAEILDVQVNIPLIHQVVVAQQAAARQGTHATKTRGEVRGGGRKPYKQKGTGRARQGSTRAPQFAGGGVVHGPQPRSYDQRTPKKMKAAALRSALSDRARNERIHVVDALISDETPSTRTALTALRELRIGAGDVQRFGRLPHRGLIVRQNSGGDVEFVGRRGADRGTAGGEVDFGARHDQVQQPLVGDQFGHSGVHVSEFEPGPAGEPHEQQRRATPGEVAGLQSFTQPALSQVTLLGNFLPAAPVGASNFPPKPLA